MTKASDPVALDQWYAIETVTHVTTEPKRTRLLGQDIVSRRERDGAPVVREIGQKLSKKNIKPWLDEADIRSGSFWHTAIGQQIETVKSAAVFIGQHGVGPWQTREIIALLDQFDKRGCPVVPAILPSDRRR